MWTMRKLLQTSPQETPQPQAPAFLPKLDSLYRQWPNSPVIVAMQVAPQGIAPKLVKPPLTCLQPMRMRRRSSFLLPSASLPPHLPAYLATLFDRDFAHLYYSFAPGLPLPRATSNVRLQMQDLGSSARTLATTTLRPGSRRLHSRSVTSCSATLFRAGARLLRDSSVRSCRVSFLLQGSAGGPRTLCGGLAHYSALNFRAFRRIAACLFPGLFRYFPLNRCRQADACTSSLRQSDGDGLLGGTRAMLALADVVHFLPHKFTGLGIWRFALTRILLRSLNRLSFRHKNLPSLPI